MAALSLFYRPIHVSNAHTGKLTLGGCSDKSFLSRPLRGVWTHLHGLQVTVTRMARKNYFHTIDRHQLISIFKEEIDDPKFFYPIQKFFSIGRLVGGRLSRINNNSSIEYGKIPQYGHSGSSSEDDSRTILSRAEEASMGKASYPYNSLPLMLHHPFQLMKEMSKTGSLLGGVQLAETLGTTGVRSPQASVLWGTVKHIRQGSMGISLLHSSSQSKAPSNIQ
ncbi:conserved hypothetical protein [Ricinus communis]|uniref:Uncharacterized protein n=1 Tax=Ricinus communis TaxID=3988 RepID=B9S677_RICCO|nr:conserved hypothetical protein [Ricinus communis]